MIRLPAQLHLTRHASFIRAVATLVSGKSLAAAISFAMTPLIARVFAPSDFGLFAVLAALVAPLAIVGTLRLDLALVVAAGQQAAQKLLVAAIHWLVLWALVLTGIVVMVARTDAGQHIEMVVQLSDWVWLVPVFVLLQGMSTFGNGWLTREATFGPLARAEVARSATVSGSRFALGLAYGSSMAWLAAGLAAGLIVQIAWQWRHLPQRLAVTLARCPWHERLAPIAPYRDFPLYNASTTLLMAISLSLPTMALGFIYNSAVVGAYAMSVRLIGSGGNLVAMSVQHAFMQRAARLYEKGQSLRGAWLKTTAVLFAAGIVPLALLLLYGEQLLVLLLGSQWRQAGTFAEIIALLLFSQWVAVPSIASITILRRQPLLLLTQCLVVIAQIFVLVVVYRRGVDAIVAIAALVAVQVAGDLIRIALGALLVRTRGARN